MNKLRIHYFQHVPYEDLGCIKDWIDKKEYKLTCTQFYKNNYILPDLKEIDWLIIMGGSMSINETGKYSWLLEEQNFIKSAINSGKTVLGICLGSQFIANALGANVYPAKNKEIGWFPIEMNVNCNLIENEKLPKELTVFHWHGDTFELPAGACRLSSSTNTHNQGFIVNKKVCAIQFHFEVTKTSVRKMVNHGINDLISTEFVQSKKEILNQSDDNYEINNYLMFEILNYLEKETQCI